MEDLERTLPDPSLYCLPAEIDLGKPTDWSPETHQLKKLAAAYESGKFAPLARHFADDCVYITVWGEEGALMGKEAVLGHLIPMGERLQRTGCPRAQIVEVTDLLGYVRIKYPYRWLPKTHILRKLRCYETALLLTETVNGKERQSLLRIETGARMQITRMLISGTEGYSYRTGPRRYL